VKDVIFSGNNVTVQPSIAAYFVMIFKINYLIIGFVKILAKTEGSLNEIDRKLKQKYAMVSEDDQLLLKGKEEELIGRLQISLGKSKEEVCKLIYE
jgi:uncharacterized protein YjbJ (UPF0337 family)